MSGWFTVDRPDRDTWILSEYRHWEETHCYLLMGKDRCLLIDTGLGIADISQEIQNLTDKPVTAVATHIHWDHIGGHRYFPDFYAHEAELDWLRGGFPIPLPAVKRMVLDRCDPPEGYDVETYELFRGTPTRVLHGGEVLDLGGRQIEVLHTPGHSPGHLCFWEPQRGYLFTGDLVYLDVLLADFPSTDPAAYLRSLEQTAALPVQRILPGHHKLDVPPEILPQMRDAFRNLNEKGLLRHGSGAYDFGTWSVRL